MSFSNKVVIVTGSSSGIGAATAILFAKEGANVTIVGRNEVKLKQVAAEITKLGRNVVIVKADISKDEEAKQIIVKTVEKFGKIDVLVNNAGLTDTVEIQNENFINSYDKVMNTNLRPVALLTSLAVPYLKKTKGNIVNVSSVAGESTLGSGGFGWAAYCTSKAGLNHFSTLSALELAEYGIRVNIVSPGPVETNILEAAGLGNVSFQDIADKGTALRVPATPDEVADVIVFLAKARTVTGSNYRIDSGFLVNGRRETNFISGNNA